MAGQCGRNERYTSNTAINSLKQPLRFRQEIGVTPANWIKEARVAAARRLLEFENAVPKQVAAQCGFANADTLRRVFVRLVGVTPAEYRKRYQTGI